MFKTELIKSALYIIQLFIYEVNPVVGFGCFRQRRNKIKFYQAKIHYGVNRYEKERLTLLKDGRDNDFCPKEIKSQHVRKTQC